MARHSKWHKVRQFKGAIDAKRAAGFTKLSREITVAVKEAGADLTTNVRLKVAIERAKKASMTKDTIERAIQRGAGGVGEGQIETVIYEAYAPGGTALIIEGMTDNRNRTTNDVKHLVSKAGGTLASSGAVTYLFDRKGIIRIQSAVLEEQELALIEAGIEDFHEKEIICAPTDLAKVTFEVQGLNLVLDSAEIEWIPKVTIETGEEEGMLLEELIEKLEDLDDVSRVFTNAT